MLADKNIFLSAICLQETWLETNSDCAPFYLPGYHEPICKYRESNISEHGGLLVYIKEDLKFKSLDKIPCTSWENQLMKVETPENCKNIILGNIYRPPNSVNLTKAESIKFFMDEFPSGIDNIAKNFNANILVCGDYN